MFSSFFDFGVVACDDDVLCVFISESDKRKCVLRKNLGFKAVDATK